MRLAAVQAAEKLLAGSPFGLDRGEKARVLLPALDALTRHHYLHCVEYRRVVDAAFGGLKDRPYASIEDLPFPRIGSGKVREVREVARGESGLRIDRILGWARGKLRARLQLGAHVGGLLFGGERQAGVPEIGHELPVHPFVGGNGCVV